jgi:hypothetical protein
MWPSDLDKPDGRCLLVGRRDAAVAAVQTRNASSVTWEADDGWGLPRAVGEQCG